MENNKRYYIIIESMRIPYKFIISEVEIKKETEKTLITKSKEVEERHHYGVSTYLKSSLNKSFTGLFESKLLAEEFFKLYNDGLIKGLSESIKRLQSRIIVFDVIKED